MANLKVTIREELTLNGYDQGATNTLTISGINELSKRIVTATTTEAGLLGFLSALSSVGVTANKVGYLAGILDDGDVKYIRITNLDGSNHITLTFRDEDNTEFRMKVETNYEARPMQPLVAMRAMKALLKDPEATEHVFVIIRALSGDAVERGYRRRARV